MVGTKVQDDTTFTSQVTSCPVHATEKAIRLHFADWVTYIPYLYVSLLQGL